MDVSYNDIINELQVFAKDYSQCHLTYSKWRSHKSRVNEPPESDVTVHEIEEKMYALVYRPKLFSIETYQFDSILKRILIKRNELVFKSIQHLWNILNPFHLPGISKQVYIKFFEFMHFGVLNFNAHADEYQKITKIDAEIDFSTSEILGFSGFYNTLFENLDVYTKSMLISEYCRILKRITSEVKISSWIKNLDLHSKIYCDGVKPEYPVWANHYKNRSVEVPKQTERNNVFTPSEKLEKLYKSYRKKGDSKIFETKYERIKSPWSFKSKFKKKNIIPLRTTEFKLRKNKFFDKPMLKLDTISPIAKKEKHFKDKQIIEVIIKDRKEKIGERNNRVLQKPFYSFI